MTQLPVLGPSNRFLTPQRDRQWPQVLSAVLLVSMLVLVVLLLVGWPRLRSTSIHYQLIGLRAEVQELERRERQLRLALEGERNPIRLGERARAMGLEPPDPSALSVPPPGAETP